MPSHSTITMPLNGYGGAKQQQPAEDFPTAYREWTIVEGIHDVEHRGREGGVLPYSRKSGGTLLSDASMRRLVVRHL